MKKYIFRLFIFTFFIVSSTTSLQVLAQHTSFKHGNYRLAAYYKKPENTKTPKGVVLFVHGDGALPYDAHGYYNPIWKQFLNSGYAVFSWSKPGVADSTGNWLSQSMKNRQYEVRAAISFVKKTYGYQAGQIGLMGFSQAGWVVPAVANNNKDVGFVIGVGFAINWMQQSWYLTKTRLKQEGATEKELKHAYMQHQKERSFWRKNPSYKQYLEEFAQDEKPMTKARFEFVKLNALSDSSKDYKGITQPILILLGENDLNVNVKNTERVLKKQFKEQSNLKFKVIPNATHSLLKHPSFSTQTPGLYFLLKLMWQGEDAYSPVFLEELKLWVNQLKTD